MKLTALIPIDSVLSVDLCPEKELHVRASKHTVRNTEVLENINKGMKLYHGILEFLDLLRPGNEEGYRDIQIKINQTRMLKMFADLWIS